MRFIHLVARINMDVHPTLPLFLHHPTLEYLPEDIVTWTNSIRKSLISVTNHLLHVNKCHIPHTVTRIMLVETL